MKKIGVLLIIATCLVACKSRPGNSLEADLFSLSIETSPCFGKCPVYTLDIDQKLFVTFKGVMYARRKGTFKTRITPAQRDEILIILENVGFWKWKEIYDNPRITDLSSTTIAVVYGKKSKKVRYRAEGPREFGALINKIHQIVEENTYERVEQK